MFVFLIHQLISPVSCLILTRYLLLLHFLVHLVLTPLDCNIPILYNRKPLGLAPYSCSPFAFYLAVDGSLCYAYPTVCWSSHWTSPRDAYTLGVAGGSLSLFFLKESESQSWALTTDRGTFKNILNHQTIFTLISTFHLHAMNIHLCSSPLSRFSSL